MIVMKRPPRIDNGEKSDLSDLANFVLGEEVCLAQETLGRRIVVGEHSIKVGSRSEQERVFGGGDGLHYSGEGGREAYTASVKRILVSHLMA